MADIPTTEPQEIVAGDTIKWGKSLSDYLASAGYTLKYRFINTSNKYDVTAAADGNDYLVTILPTASALYSAGTYAWTAYIEKGSGQTLERYTVGNGTIKIKPNLAAQTAGYDNRSHIKKVLDAIEAAVEGRATRTDLAHTIQGRSIQHMAPTELIKWHSHYKRLYQSELDAEKINQGLATGRKILTRFV